MFDNRPGRHARAAPRCDRRRRRVAGRIAMAVLGMAAIVTVGWLVMSPEAAVTASVRAAAPVSWPGAGKTAAASQAPASPPRASRSPAGTGGLALSPGARRSCPAAASACVDLSDHVSWLQSNGRVIYGPVRMEPGGHADPTPRGVFHVAWKAGAHYISTSFGVPIPYAVFFAPGGIAFHAGSLTSSSHGCVHLTMRNARYYHDHLAIGAEVAVF